MLRRAWRSTFGLLATVALGFALVTVAIGIIAVHVTHEALEAQLDDRVRTEVAALLDEHTEGGTAKLVAAIHLREATRSQTGLEYLMFDTGGTQLAGSTVAVMPVHVGYEEHFHYRRGEHEGIAQAMATRVPGGLLVVAADRAQLVTIDRQLTTLFVVALGAMLLMGIGSAALIGLATRRRLARIEATARAIMKGEFTRRIPVEGSQNEFDRLGRILNQMLDRMGGLMDNLRQVSSDVAHDLRTPLTRLYGNLDLAMTETDPQAKAGRIEAARRQSAELLQIFSALLRIAEIEGMAERLPRQRLDLSGLVAQMGDTYRPDMENRDCRFACTVEPELALDGDARLLSQAMANLLDNALRHAPPGSKVELTAGRQQGDIVIRVADDGPGVDEADLPRLFQRFARSERSRSTPGHGLGLALVAAVAAAHGGVAEARSSKGFEAVLRLPAPAG